MQPVISRKAVIRCRMAIGVVAATLAIAPSIPSASAQTTLKFLSSWSAVSNLTGDFVVNTIIDEAKKLSNGAVVIRRFGPEVVPPFEQLQPVSAGTFDMLYTHPAYHGGATAVGSLIDSIVGDRDMRRETGIFDWIDQYYQKNFNMKLLGITTQTGYQFLLKEPIEGDKALEGRKIRSNPAYDPLIKALGGAPVLLPVPQIYTAMQKGLVDGSAYTLNSLVKQSFYEVAKFMARPTFGGANTFEMMNLKKWQALDSKTQDIILAAVEKAERGLPWFAEKLKIEDEQGMILHGSRFTFFDEENARRLTTLFNEGLWQQAITKSGAAAEELIALVKKKGMVNR